MEYRNFNKMHMIIFLLSALMAFYKVQALTASQIEILEKATTECLKQSGTTPEAVESALNSTDTSNVSASVKSCAHCLLEKTGVLVNEVVQSKVLIDFYGPAYGLDKVNSIIAKCNGLKGKDINETAFLLLHCFVTTRRAL